MKYLVGAVLFLGSLCLAGLLILAPASRKQEVKSERAEIEKVADDSNVIGRWIDPGIGKITIYGTSDKYTLEEVFFIDGSKMNRDLVETASNVGRRFDYREGSPTGDYYIIDSENNLEIWDRRGLITMANSEAQAVRHPLINDGEKDWLSRIVSETNRPCENDCIDLYKKKQLKQGLTFQECVSALCE